MRRLNSVPPADAGKATRGMPRAVAVSLLEEYSLAARRIVSTPSDA